MARYQKWFRKRKEENAEMQLYSSPARSCVAQSGGLLRRSWYEGRERQDAAVLADLAREEMLFQPFVLLVQAIRSKRSEPVGSHLLSHPRGAAMVHST